MFVKEVDLRVMLACMRHLTHHAAQIVIHPEKRKSLVLGEYIPVFYNRLLSILRGENFQYWLIKSWYFRNDMWCIGYIYPSILITRQSVLELCILGGKDSECQELVFDLYVIHSCTFTTWLRQLHSYMSSICVLLPHG